MMLIDAMHTQTVAFVTLVVSVVVALGLYVFGLKQRTFQGFDHFAVASGSVGVGLLLIALRGDIPDWLSIVMGNTLLITGFVLYFEGIRRFLDLAEEYHVVGAASIILTLAIMVVFTYLYPSERQRIIGISITSLVISGYSVRDLLTRVPGYWRLHGRVLGVALMGMGVFYSYRMLVTLWQRDIPAVVETQNVLTYASIPLLIIITGNAFCLVWMVGMKYEMELIKLAVQDPLTRILNRRGVESFAEQELLKVKRMDNDLAIMMMDIDHFKSVNDRFGHQVGDRVLRDFVRLVQSNIRPYDILGRIGGEEFVLIMPDTSRDQALVLAERLRNLVGEFAFDVGEQSIELTTSFGLANYFPGTDTISTMMGLADEALYHSKEKGRNKVTHYAHLSGEGELHPPGRVGEKAAARQPEG